MTKLKSAKKQLSLDQKISITYPMLLEVARGSKGRRWSLKAPKN